VIVFELAIKRPMVVFFCWLDLYSLKKTALALASAAQKKTEPWRNAKVLLINA
jgi:hypothetical protein